MPTRIGPPTSPEPSSGWSSAVTAGREPDGTESRLTSPRCCPCGCLTKLPYFDDPDCIRHQPAPGPGERASYDVHDLGLAPHDRATCEHCGGAA